MTSVIAAYFSCFLSTVHSVKSYLTQRSVYKSVASWPAEYTNTSSTFGFNCIITHHYIYPNKLLNSTSQTSGVQWPSYNHVWISLTALSHEEVQESNS